MSPLLYCNASSGNICAILFGLPYSVLTTGDSGSTGLPSKYGPSIPPPWPAPAASTALSDARFFLMFPCAGIGIGTVCCCAEAALFAGGAVSARTSVVSTNACGLAAPKPDGCCGWWSGSGGGATFSACESGVRDRAAEEEEADPSGVRDRERLEGMEGMVGPRKRGGLCCTSSCSTVGKCGGSDAGRREPGRLKGVPTLELPFSLADKPLVRTKAVERRWCGLRS